jgi:hypothetical protein
MPLTQEEIEQLYRDAASKIDLSYLPKERGGKLDSFSFRELTALIAAHGKDGVVSLIVLGNHKDGFPSGAPTGYVMKYNPEKARCVPEAYNLDHAFGGTAFFKLSEEQVEKCGFSDFAKLGEFSKALLNSEMIKEQKTDKNSFIGAMTKTNAEGKQEYWFVARAVNEVHNRELRQAFTDLAGKPLGQVLKETSAQRLISFTKQRQYRASIIKRMLSFCEINVELKNLLESENYSDVHTNFFDQKRDVFLNLAFALGTLKKKEVLLLDDFRKAPVTLTMKRVKGIAELSYLPSTCAELKTDAELLKLSKETPHPRELPNFSPIGNNMCHPLLLEGATSAVIADAARKCQHIEYDVDDKGWKIIAMSFADPFLLQEKEDEEREKEMSARA